MKLPINAFCLKGYNNEKISLIINEIIDFPSTSYHGGHDITCSVEIQAGNYRVIGERYYTTTGDLYRFNEELQKCYNLLEGNADYKMFYEKDLVFSVNMLSGGHAVVKGTYQERADKQNILEFEIETDQSCFLSVIQSINQLKDKLGGK